MAEERQTFCHFCRHRSSQRRSQFVVPRCADCARYLNVLYDGPEADWLYADRLVRSAQHHYRRTIAPAH